VGEDEKGRRAQKQMIPQGLERQTQAGRNEPPSCRTGKKINSND